MPTPQWNLPDDDYRPFWRCPDCGREYDDIDNGPCPADDCPSRDNVDDEGPEHHATLESAFADAIGHDNYQRLLDQKWLPFAGRTHLSMSLADAVAREVKAATKFLQTLDTVEDEGPEPPYAGYESEAQLQRMAEVRRLEALRREGLIP